MIAGMFVLIFDVSFYSALETADVVWLLNMVQHFMCSLCGRGIEIAAKPQTVKPFLVGVFRNV